MFDARPPPSLVMEKRISGVLLLGDEGDVVFFIFTNNAWRLTHKLMEVGAQITDYSSRTTSPFIKMSHIRTKEAHRNSKDGED